MKNNIIAIVVTYNRKNLLLECIDALLKQEKVSCDILIVDNNSNDGTELAVQEIKQQNIVYVNTGENLGGAGGFNFGIKKAVELGYKYVWLMDDDCIPYSTSLFELNEAAKKHENFGFLSSKVTWIDDNPCVMNIQRKTMYKNIKKETNFNTEITMASFVSCFISMEVIKDLGFPIKEFFIWTDDWEFTRRISKKYKSFYIPNSIVIHKTKENIGANISNTSIEKINRFFYLYRNDIYLYRREFIIGWIYILIRLFFHFFKILFISKDNKIKRIWQMLKGTFAGLLFYPKIEKFKISK